MRRKDGREGEMDLHKKAYHSLLNLLSQNLGEIFILEFHFW